MVEVDGEECMLVWGGLHNGRPTGQLEIYNFSRDIWKPITADGIEPAARFGHSCTPVDSSRLVFIGGSNGTDLLRDGIEYRNVRKIRVNYYNIVFNA